MTTEIKKPLGEIFVERGLLTRMAVQRLVEHAKYRDMRLGEFLEIMGIVTSEELAEALAIQYRCRTLLRFAHYAYPRNLLKLIPLDIAVNHTIFPLKMDDGKLALAVADPTKISLFKDLTAKNNLRVIVFVSTRLEIQRAIARHYIGRPLSEQVHNSILVVEDDELLRRNLAKTLERRGYLVETASDGYDALAKIFTTRPKLVITDKAMPKLDGMDFLQAIRHLPEFRDLPLILTTVAATQDEEERALGHGYFAVVGKPVRDVTLFTRVSRAMQSSENLYRYVG
jgi:CheY-like chemotaxis protein